MATRHFLSLLDLNPAELKQLIKRASELKKMQHAGEIHEPLRNKVLAMIFEKSSTRQICLLRQLPPPYGQRFWKRRSTAVCIGHGRTQRF